MTTDMTLDEAYEYVEQANERESEQRGEYLMGAVSLGYDASEWAVAYDGYRTSEDETYAEAQKVIEHFSTPETYPWTKAETYRPVNPSNDPDTDVPF